MPSTPEDHSRVLVSVKMVIKVMVGILSGAIVAETLLY
jgi:hypothetical protein